MMIQQSFACLIAETRMAEVSQQYREEVASSGTAGWWYILIPFVAIGLACLIQYIGNRPPVIVNTPDGLLHELCKVHRIPNSGRVILELLADEADLAHPAILFVSEAQFDDAVANATRRHKLDRRKEASLGELRRRLFA